jgi:hypothetical protein
MSRDLKIFVVDTGPAAMSDGTMIDRILLDATDVDMDDDMSVWGAAGDFVHWAETQAYLLPGEFPESLHNLSKVSYYAAEIDNGGHMQFAQNSGWQPDVIESVTVGLKEIGATEFSSVYEEFRRLMETEPELHSEVLNQESSAIPTAIDDLDERFFQLGGAKKLVEHGAAWVRSLPNVAFVPWEQLQSERAAVIARNTLLESRRAERVAALEAAEAENPWYVAAARRLCALRGLTFSRLTTGSITSEPHIMRWGIVTTEGVFYMLIGPEEAELQEAETGNRSA